MTKVMNTIMSVAFAAIMMIGFATSANAAYTHTGLLQSGSNGAQVMDMQIALNAAGANPVLKVDGNFGMGSFAAVKAFQTANGLVSDGYVGAMTGAVLAGAGSMTGGSYPDGCTSAAGYSSTTGNKCDAEATPAVEGCTGDAMFSSTTGEKCEGASTGEVLGGAGSILDADFVSSYNVEEVGEGENDVIVAGLEIEAGEESDIELRAVRLTFAHVLPAGAGSDDDFDDYASEVVLMMDDVELARVDASHFDDDNSYTRTLSLKSGAVIRADKIGDLVVAVSGVSNLDSNNEGEDWTVSFTSIRFMDGQGAITTDAGTDDIGATRQFSFENFASAADIEFKVKSGDNDVNDSRVISVDQTEEEQSGDMLSFEIQIEGNSDVELKDLPISAAFTGTATNLDDIFSTMTLTVDGMDFEENAPAAGMVIFEDIDMMLEAGNTYEVTLSGDILDLNAATYATGDTVVFTFGETETDNAGFDAEDANGDNLQDADKKGTESTEAHTLSLSAFTIDATANSATTNETDTTGYISFTIEADAVEEDFTFDIANNSALDGLVDDVRFTKTGTDITIGVATLTKVNGDATYAGTTWTVLEGDDATFALDVTFTTVDGADNGVYRVNLDSVSGQTIDLLSGSINLSN